MILARHLAVSAGTAARERHPGGYSSPWQPFRFVDPRISQYALIPELATTGNGGPRRLTNSGRCCTRQAHARTQALSARRSSGHAHTCAHRMVSRWGTGACSLGAGVRTHRTHARTRARAPGSGADMQAGGGGRRRANAGMYVGWGVRSTGAGASIRECTSRIGVHSRSTRRHGCWGEGAGACRQTGRRCKRRRKRRLLCGWRGGARRRRRRLARGEEVFCVEQAQVQAHIGKSHA